MNLSPRLQAIVNHVPKDTICADIGTDHAYIPIYLIKNKICSKIIASDIHEGPLEIAKSQIKLAGFEKQIETRLGNGLELIKAGEVDTVVIAGMGGLLIRDILENSKEVTRSIQTLILQPMIAQKELRKYLIEHNYTIVKEDLAKEDQRIYEIIIAGHGKQKVEEEIYLDIPKYLIEKRHPLLKSLLQRKKNELLKIIQHCAGKHTPSAEDKIKECKEKIIKFEEVEECL